MIWIMNKSVKKLFVCISTDIFKRHVSVKMFETDRLMYWTAWANKLVFAFCYDDDDDDDNDDDNDDNKYCDEI